MKFLIIPLALVILSCSEKNEGLSTSSNVDTNPTTQVSNEWVIRDQSAWPQFVLTNRASFAGHTSLQGASSFLIENKQGAVFAVTAKHLIGVNGGVTPEISVSNLKSVLKEWVIYPRTKPDEKVALTGEVTKGLEDPNADLLVIKLKEYTDLPSKPLLIRDTTIEVGEKVFLIGVPYSDTSSSQNIYEGTVTERKFGHRFRYSIKPSVDIRGFSGAPIIDSKGFLVGIMTVWFNPVMDGDLYMEAGGEDVISLVKSIN